MSGHNKWSTIKRKKEKEDNKRGRIFTKVIKEITLAARDGGGDPDGNPRLRTAILNAKESNMPADNIERAIKKGTGELPGVVYEEITYEGHAFGVSLLIEVVTDNRNRATGEIRHVFTRHSGDLGAVGSVTWMFDKKGMIEVDGSKTKFDDVMEIAADAGAEDVVEEDGIIHVTTQVADTYKVKKVLEDKGISVTNAQMIKVPQSTVQLDEGKSASFLKLVDALEDLDDVQNVYSNIDISDEMMEKLSQ